jgi:hypothetical protein
VSNRGYIGKISAIVTVNTADASRAFNKSADEAQNYGKRLESSIRAASNNAAKSFEGMFSQFEKLQRTFRAAQSANFNLPVNPKALEQLALAAKQLADPLAAATKQFDGLAFSVQRQFSPALTAVKAEVLAVRDALNANESVGRETFKQLAGSVERVTGSISRLNETASLTKKLLTTQDAQGLAFVRPEAFDSINKLVEAQRGLSSLPAATRGSPAVRELIEQAQVAQAQINKITARIERLSSQGLDIRVSQAGLDAAVRRLDEVRQRTEAIKAQSEAATRAFSPQGPSREQRGLGLFGSQVGTDAERAIARAREVSAAFAELPESAQTGLAGLAGIASRVANGVQAGTTNAVQLNSLLDRLAAGVARATEASRAFQLIEPAREQRGLGLFGSQVGTDAERAIARAREVSAAFAELPESAQTGLAGLAGIASRVANGVQAGTSNAVQLNSLLDRLAAGVARATPTGPQGPPLPPGFGGQSDAGLGAALTDPSRQLDALRGGITSVKSQIDQLPAGLRQQFIPAITAAEAEFRRLAAAPNQSAVAIDVARQRLLQLTREAGRASEALNFRRSFGSRDAIIGSLQTQQLRGYTAQVQILQGELASVTGLARGPAVAAISRLGTVISEQMRRGTIDTQAARQEVQRLTADAVRATAAARGISPRALGRTVARAGDVGRQGFANLSLGIQQAAFAFEDFFSVTGGLDQRIRAAGNNISQLGFVLGSTEGLIAGIAVAIGAQLVASIIKWTGVTEDAEKQQRELKDALSSTNSALERQRQLAEQLRDVYRDLAKSIAEAGEPERFRNERQQREQINAVQRQQEERRRAAIEANSPQIARQRGRIAEIDRQLETEQNAATRRRLIERRNAADLAARREIDDIERRGAQNAGVAVQARGGLTGALRDQNDRRAAVQQELGAAARRDNVGEVSRLSRELAVIENTIQRLADASVRLGAERGQGLIGGLNRGLERTQGIEGVSQIEAASSLVRGEFERLQNELSDGTLSFDRFNVELQKAQAVGTILEQASEQARAFSDALQSAATDLARSVEQEAGGRAVSQRRTANAAEAEFGANDPRAQIARRQQQQSEAESRRTEQERQRIDAESQRIIRQFEGQARAGRGDPQAAALATRIQEIEASLANAPRTPAEAGEQDRLRPELEDNRRRLRQLAEATPDVAQLRQQTDANDTANQRFNQNQDAVRRGIEAAITPAQQASDALKKAFSDLKAALAENAIGLDAFNEAVKRTVEDQEKAIAPLVFDLAEQVQNARMQGPSRAALGASDASTAQGQQELNRLLRGDDAARDQNLVELKRQTQLLKQIRDKRGAEVAN